MPTPLLRHAHCATKVHVTVTDLSGVQRVLMLLTGRQYEITRFSAEEFGEGRWRTSFDLIVKADQSDLLAERLHRIPSVLLVDIRPGKQVLRVPGDQTSRARAARRVNDGGSSPTG